MQAAPEEEPHVYWEAQENSLLCGLHCLNALLQFPALDEVRLAAIGQTLDAREQQLTGHSAANNLSDAGDFNLQVLVEALQHAGSFAVESAQSSENRGRDLSAETALVCNHHGHWFCLRRVAGRWVNLNSLAPAGPELLRPEELRALLAPQPRRHLFVVRGEFPCVDRLLFADGLAPHQHYFPLAALEAAREDAGAAELDRAVRASLESFARERGRGVAVAEGVAGRYLDEEDEEAVLAYRLSLRDKFPEADAFAVAGPLIRVRLPDGRVAERRFAPDQPLRDLYDFAFLAAESGNAAFVLRRPFPPAALPADATTLDAAGLSGEQTLLYAPGQGGAGRI